MSLLVRADGSEYNYQAYDGDAGIDLPYIGDPVILQPGMRKLLDTGLFLQDLPDGHFAQICPRSGLANKFGVTVLNSPGIIDPGYKGELKVNLINLGHIKAEFTSGDRIAQLVILPYWNPGGSSRVRGANGHGSSS